MYLGTGYLGTVGTGTLNKNPSWKPLNSEQVYRHGNHNYFKATFMFYHTDIYDRILGRGTNIMNKNLNALQFNNTKVPTDRRGRYLTCDKR